MLSIELRGWFKGCSISLGSPPRGANAGGPKAFAFEYIQRNESDAFVLRANKIPDAAPGSEKKDDPAVAGFPGGRRRTLDATRPPASYLRIRRSAGLRRRARGLVARLSARTQEDFRQTERLFAAPSADQTPAVPRQDRRPEAEEMFFVHFWLARWALRHRTRKPYELVFELVHATQTLGPFAPTFVGGLEHVVAAARTFVVWALLRHRLMAAAASKKTKPWRPKLAKLAERRVSSRHLTAHQLCCFAIHAATSSRPWLLAHP